MDRSIVLKFNLFCKKGDVMYAYHLARVIIMRASFSVSRTAAFSESCNKA